MSMGIYLPNMEMPTDCWDCPLRNTKLCPCKGYTTALEYTANRHPNCPLVPVPKHGRLGDLDELIDKVIAKYLEHERKGELLFAAAEIKQDIVDLISNAPTIIPAEEGEA
jgi:hypothetical protein